MSKPLAFGLKKSNITKPRVTSFKRPSAFGETEIDEATDVQHGKTEVGVEEIGGGELDDFSTTVFTTDSRRTTKPRTGLSSQPPKIKSRPQSSAMFGDLSSSLSSKKNAHAATELDSKVYEYDSVYDSLKPKKEDTSGNIERKPKYMRSLLQAAEVRKRDALIAEEKKIAREREAEGDEFVDKEKFVTEAYRRQQEENRRLEEEEKRREEEEAKKNKGGGMSAFYRKLLDKDEARHSEIVKSVAEKARQEPIAESDQKFDEPDMEKSEAQQAKELNEKGASVAVNEDGQVVDKRQLLKGGLNVSTKKKVEVKREADRLKESDRRNVSGMQVGKKQAMRERQTRMIEEQLEQSLKRSREAEEAQRLEMERASKSRKTETEISNAKERYLARKKAAEEAKKQGPES